MHDPQSSTFNHHPPHLLLFLRRNILCICIVRPGNTAWTTRTRETFSTSVTVSDPEAAVKTANPRPVLLGSPAHLAAMAWVVRDDRVRGRHDRARAALQ